MPCALIQLVHGELTSLAGHDWAGHGQGMTAARALLCNRWDALGRWALWARTLGSQPCRCRQELCRPGGAAEGACGAVQLGCCRRRRHGARSDGRQPPAAAGAGAACLCGAPGARAAREQLRGAGGGGPLQQGGLNGPVQRQAPEQLHPVQPAAQQTLRGAPAACSAAPPAPPPPPHTPTTEASNTSLILDPITAGRAVQCSRRPAASSSWAHLVLLSGCSDRFCTTELTSQSSSGSAPGSSLPAAKLRCSSVRVPSRAGSPLRASAGWAFLRTLTLSSADRQAL
jgi:hypothetical protein